MMFVLPCETRNADRPTCRAAPRTFTCMREIRLCFSARWSLFKRLDFAARPRPERDFFRPLVEDEGQGRPAGRGPGRDAAQDVWSAIPAPPFRRFRGAASIIPSPRENIAIPRMTTSGREVA